MRTFPQCYIGLRSVADFGPQVMEQCTCISRDFELTNLPVVEL